MTDLNPLTGSILSSVRTEGAREGVGGAVSVVVVGGAAGVGGGEAAGVGGGGAAGVGGGVERNSNPYSQL